MTLPNLKRIKVSGSQEIESWLSKNVNFTEQAMLVTHTEASHTKHVSNAQVQASLEAHGWISKRRYTLNKTLIGHVICKSETV